MQLIFMDTELFRAVFAAQVIVCLCRETFGMPVERDLPADHQDQGHKQQAPQIAASYKEQRREHHRIIPVVDPADAAAFVLKEP